MPVSVGSIAVDAQAHIAYYAALARNLLLSMFSKCLGGAIRLLATEAP